MCVYVHMHARMCVARLSCILRRGLQGCQTVCPLLGTAEGEQLYWKNISNCMCVYRITTTKAQCKAITQKTAYVFGICFIIFYFIFFVRFILTLHNLFRFLALSATHTHTHAASVRVGERYNLKPLTLSCLCSQRCRYLCRCRRRRRRCCRIWTLPF